MAAGGLSHCIVRIQQEAALHIPYTRDGQYYRKRPVCVQVFEVACRSAVQTQV